MTLLQITAIEIDDAAQACCRGAIHQAAIGRARGPVDAVEVDEDLGHGANSYFAQVDGRLVDVAVEHCPTCGSPALTSDSPVDIGNELLRLPKLACVAPPAVDDVVPVVSAPPRGNWRARLQPRARAGR